MHWTIAVRLGKSALVALFLSLLFTLIPARAGETFEREPLTLVRSDQSRIPLTVELALSAAQREQGLMFRKQMADDAGMLFDFGETRMVYMWMKNTDLPLDMLFLDEKGVVTHVHERAVPQSQDIITSVDPVRYVIELNAGSVARLGITRGSVAISRQIGNMDEGN